MLVVVSGVVSRCGLWLSAAFGQGGVHLLCFQLGGVFVGWGCFLVWVVRGGCGCVFLGEMVGW